jgi:hypothetical protein
MARTPKRLAGPALVATGPATIYTVPAVTKTIVRHIHVSNPSGSPVTLTLSVGADAAGTRLLGAYSIPAAAAGVTDSVRDIWLYVPMEAAEILQAAAGTNNVLVIVVSGDELTLG